VNHLDVTYLTQILYLPYYFALAQVHSVLVCLNLPATQKKASVVEGKLEKKETLADCGYIAYKFYKSNWPCEHIAWALQRACTVQEMELH
jgi:hypothetical protein